MSKGPRDEPDPPPAPGDADISCPRCGCRFTVDSLTVRVAGSERSHEVELEPSASGRSIGRIIADAQRELVIAALREAGGDGLRAATLAGLDYETFYALVEGLDISPGEIRRDEED